MKPTKEIGERRKAELTSAAEGQADVERAVAGDRRGVEGRSVGAAMVDALEDILKYERSSERTVKAAKAALN